MDIFYELILETQQKCHYVDGIQYWQLSIYSLGLNKCLYLASENKSINYDKGNGENSG